MRPLESSGELHGHLHAAVFPYRPIKKRTLQLHEAVRELFDKGEIEDVMHLMHDPRSESGKTESALFSGACWIGELGQIKAMD